VFATDGILNSVIHAGHSIVCYGKRAAIIGGELCAGELVSAKTLGSSQAGTETLCEVGYDPAAKVKLGVLQNQHDAMKARYDDIEMNINTLDNIRKQRKKLPQEKEDYYAELCEQRTEVSADLERVKEQIVEAREFLESLSLNGRVSASFKVYPGVVIYIRDKRFTVNMEYQPITFVLKNGIVKAEHFTEEQRGDSESA
jgi:uncharacterized protein (DUF342 family)